MFATLTHGEIVGDSARGIVTKQPIAHYCPRCGRHDVMVVRLHWLLHDNGDRRLDCIALGCTMCDYRTTLRAAKFV